MFNLDDLSQWRTILQWLISLRTGNRKGFIMIGTQARPEHREGVVARKIEEQTAKLPSDTWLWLAGGSIAASLTAKLTGRDHTALFFGQWAPTFLLLGLYNKIVKVAGSDGSNE
jgi:hypothetical protein